MALTEMVQPRNFQKISRRNPKKLKKEILKKYEEIQKNLKEEILNFFF